MYISMARTEQREQAANGSWTAVILKLTIGLLI